MPNQLEQSLEPPTLSEVVRLLNGLTRKIDNMGNSFVSQQVYAADKEGITLKFERSHEVHVEIKTEMAKAEAELKAELKAEVKSLKGEIETNRNAIEANRLAEKERNLRFTIALVTAGLAGFVSLVVTLVSKGLGA